jgi:GGDEF domain-containing protein
LSDASAAAARLKEAIKLAPVVLPDGTALPRIGISTGVSVALPEDTWNTLIARSDIAMEQSKSYTA